MRKLEDPLRPLPNYVVAEMQSILTNIENGKYQHDQSVWHCGTAHCFAGWKEVRDFSKFMKSAVEKLWDWDKIFHSTTEEYAKQRLWDKVGEMRSVNTQGQITSAMSDRTGTYAELQWGLTHAEANLLFEGENSLDDIQGAVSQFKDGFRFVVLKEQGYRFGAWVHPEKVCRDDDSVTSRPVWVAREKNNGEEKTKTDI